MSFSAMTVFVLLGILLLLPASSNAACTSETMSGSFTINSNCAFAGNVDGVDNGTLTVTGGTVTVNANQTLVYNGGGFGIALNGGNLAVSQSNAKVVRGKLWLYDADADGWPSSTIQIYTTSTNPAPANYRRRMNMSSTAMVGGVVQVDCDDANAGSNASCGSGSGADGPLTVTPANSPYNINTTRVSLTASASAGASTVSTNGVSAFVVGDEALVIQMNGTGVGTFEAKKIQSIGSNQITFTTPLTNTYYGSAAQTQTISWINGYGVVGYGTGGLQKNLGTNNWDSGAVSSQVIYGGDGYVQTVATETNTYRMFGLGYTNASYSYTDIDFALYPAADGNLYVYESGQGMANLGAYATNDTLQVAVSGGSVQYKKNGAVLYTSTRAPKYPLRADTSFYTNGSTINNSSISGYFSTNRAQLVRMPNFTYVDVQSGGTLTAPAWDWNAGTGGVLVFRANGTTTVTGAITMTGKGFPGGGGGPGGYPQGPGGAGADGGWDGNAANSVVCTTPGTVVQFNAQGGGGGALGGNSIYGNPGQGGGTDAYGSITRCSTTGGYAYAAPGGYGGTGGAGGWGVMPGGGSLGQGAGGTTAGGVNSAAANLSTIIMGGGGGGGYGGGGGGAGGGGAGGGGCEGPPSILGCFSRGGATAGGWGGWGANGGWGGTGGGVIIIKANKIIVSGSVVANGNAGASGGAGGGGGAGGNASYGMCAGVGACPPPSDGWGGGGGGGAGGGGNGANGGQGAGGGAGGSILLSAPTLSIGTNLITVTQGGAGGGGGAGAGGVGGVGGGATAHCCEWLQVSTAGESKNGVQAPSGAAGGAGTAGGVGKLKLEYTSLTGSASQTTGTSAPSGW